VVHRLLDTRSQQLAFHLRDAGAVVAHFEADAPVARVRHADVHRRVAVFVVPHGVVEQFLDSRVYLLVRLHPRRVREVGVKLRLGMGGPG